jgi:hypothetical protein
MSRHDDLAQTEIKVFESSEEAEKTAENLRSLAYPHDTHTYHTNAGWVVMIEGAGPARYLRKDGIVR